MEVEYFNFNDHVESVEWIYQLPAGLVSEKIDLRYNSVNIKKEKNGYQIYIGPKNPNDGGDGLLINLDNNLKLINYVVERIDPTPQIERE
ncbi:hypothetical protein H0A36_00580 [Endozoicomonas sp. SM1973]|uniref:Uncharacterized protein n=1 Tax=Spartinivicinus marinus TaxID=2994442 RepID=A0A853HRQ1_9GAMM|nr:hypothetical protein [Spartinivicinus marinus]MCX4026646.1 hypothetical protein [Spartinivicinus marinus]NYZ64480.1 hypothetical protein [Spartinivicinus marinus]